MVQPGSVAVVNLEGRIRAIRLRRTAIGTACRSAFGRIFSRKPAHIPKGIEGFHRASHQPAHHVQIVARFGQNNGCGLHRIVPVSAHKRMAHMDVLYRLKMLHGNHLAQHAGLHDFAQFFKVGSIAKDMTDRDDFSAAFGQF